MLFHNINATSKLNDTCSDLPSLTFVYNLTNPKHDKILISTRLYSI